MIKNKLMLFSFMFITFFILNCTVSAAGYNGTGSSTNSGTSSTSCTSSGNLLILCNSAAQHNIKISLVVKENGKIKQKGNAIYYSPDSSLSGKQVCGKISNNKYISSCENVTSNNLVTSLNGVGTSTWSDYPGKLENFFLSDSNQGKVKELTQKFGVDFSTVDWNNTRIVIEPIFYFAHSSGNKYYTAKGTATYSSCGTGSKLKSCRFPIIANAMYLEKKDTTLGISNKGKYFTYDSGCSSGFSDSSGIDACKNLKSIRNGQGYNIVDINACDASAGMCCYNRNKEYVITYDEDEGYYKKVNGNFVECNSGDGDEDTPETSCSITIKGTGSFECDSQTGGSNVDLGCNGSNSQTVTQNCSYKITYKAVGSKTTYTWPHCEKTERDPYRQEESDGTIRCYTKNGVKRKQAKTCNSGEGTYDNSTKKCKKTDNINVNDSKYSYTISGINISESSELKFNQDSSSHQGGGIEFNFNLNNSFKIEIPSVTFSSLIAQRTALREAIKGNDNYSGCTLTNELSSKSNGVYYDIRNNVLDKIGDGAGIDESDFDIKIDNEDITADFDFDFNHTTNPSRWPSYSSRTYDNNGDNTNDGWYGFTYLETLKLEAAPKKSYINKNTGEVEYENYSGDISEYVLGEDGKYYMPIKISSNSSIISVNKPSDRFNRFLYFNYGASYTCETSITKKIYDCIDIPGRECNPDEPGKFKPTYYYRQIDLSNPFPKGDYSNTNWKNYYGASVSNTNRRKTITDIGTSPEYIIDLGKVTIDSNTDYSLKNINVNNGRSSLLGNFTISGVTTSPKYFGLGTMGDGDAR